MSDRLVARTRALEALLERIAREHSPAALASSLSAEDMVITDAIARRGLPIDVFVLDTGRLHGDTLALLAEIRRRYGRDVGIFRPDPAAVARYVTVHGRDALYESPDLRRLCCEIRKVEPLRRALTGRRAWITGQRRAQSVTRSTLAAREHDAGHGIEKFNPLADWSEGDVWGYIRANEVPYNALYEQGYRSIGCAPCTRPTAPAEDPRAGRWWWEDPAARECGLHVAPGGPGARASHPAGTAA
jgi:phosphoadenosine phosphosulfate reductase